MFNFIFWAVIVYSAATYDYDSDIHKQNVYVESCIRDTDKVCENKRFEKITIKTDFQKQKVFKSKGYGAAQYDCTVLDKDNWDCKNFHMANGIYTAYDITSPNGKITIEERPSSIWQYYIKNYGDNLTSLFVAFFWLCCAYYAIKCLRITTDWITALINRVDWKRSFIRTVLFFAKKR